jgi:hypothetical protein
VDAKNLKREDKTWPRRECHKSKLEEEGLKQKKDKLTVVVATTTTTDTFNSSKTYSPFSLWLILNSFWDCRSCTR